MRSGQYDWRGGRESVSWFGPEQAPVLIVILPLLEEANRMRTFVVRLLRLLAAKGVASALPDLPATGESLLPTYALHPDPCRSALAELIVQSDRRCHVLGIRSGCLLDDVPGVVGRYHLAPVTGEQFVRDLGRSRQAQDSVRQRLGEQWHLDERWHETRGQIRVAGNLLSVDALDAFARRTFDERPSRTARLSTDAAPADVRFDSRPLWRSKEPEDDPVFAAALAEDVHAWMATCEG